LFEEKMGERRRGVEKRGENTCLALYTTLGFAGVAANLAQTNHDGSIDEYSIMIIHLRSHGCVIPTNSMQIGVDLSRTKITISKCPCIYYFVPTLLLPHALNGSTIQLPRPQSFHSEASAAYTEAVPAGTDSPQEPQKYETQPGTRCSVRC
jgi:hypothetical protein